MNSTLRNLQKSESFGRKISKNSADQDWIQMAGPKPFDTMHSCIVLQSFRYHSNVVLSSFRCRFVPRDMTNFLRWNDPKTKISLVAGSFLFRTRRNDTRSSFEGTTGTQLERPTVFEEGGSNGGEGGQNDPGPTVIPLFVPVVRSSFLVPGSFRIIREQNEILE